LKNIQYQKVGKTRETHYPLILETNVRSFLTEMCWKEKIYCTRMRHSWERFCPCENPEWPACQTDDVSRTETAEEHASKPCPDCDCEENMQGDKTPPRATEVEKEKGRRRESLAAMDLEPRSNEKGEIELAGRETTEKPRAYASSEPSAKPQRKDEKQ
jgi:hypothetical protein